MNDLQVITTTGAKGALDQAAVEGLATGLRHSEMLGAQFKHFDPARRRLRVQVKGGHWRDQPVLANSGHCGKPR